MTHIMVDLETMSSAPDAAIVALGAIVFDPYGPHLDVNDVDSEIAPHCFYINISLQSCIDHGLRVDGSTVMWWLKQSQEAREALQWQVPATLPQALTVFNSWLAQWPAPVHVWSHATFDVPVLTSAYLAAKLHEPWKYQLCRDVRTVYDLAFPTSRVPGVPNLNKHNALYDAFSQAVGVQICYTKLYGTQR